MNEPQRFWWEQAKSDHAVFVLLRVKGVGDCHLLHYLQMAAEKISKAYLWRSGTEPPRSHVGLMPFLQALISRSLGHKEQQRIAEIFDFRRRQDMEAWVRQVSPLAHELQNITPALAQDGPNTEYPWPPAHPTNCPALHSFDLWASLRDQAQGRSLLKFIERATHRFEQYA